MELDEAIALVNKEGFWVNNLCQKDDGTWYASLKKLLPTGQLLYEFGYGTLPHEALLAALVKTKLEGKELPRLWKPEKPANFFKGKKIDIDSLLDELEL